MKISRQKTRKEGLPWVREHLRMMKKHGFGRAPLPDKRSHTMSRGRKTANQGWTLIIGFPKVQRN